MRRVAPIMTLLIAAFASHPAVAQNQPANPVANELAVQSALRQGRQLLAKGETKQAIDVLEARLAIINGNSDYLAVLRDAYVACIRELQMNKLDQQAAEILTKLKAIDAACESPSPARSEAPELPPVSAAPKARAKIDPFQQTPLLDGPRPGELIRQGDAAFAQKRYADAAAFYNQAAARDANALGDSKGKWAYCRIFQAVEHLKSEPADPAALGALEKEVTEAVALAADKPELAGFGNDVLKRIRQKRGPAAASDAAAEGWLTEESANFRLLHHHSREFAQRVVQQAENSRTAAVQKWFGADGNNWNPRCDLYLHATAGDYARATSKDFRAAGHSTLEVVNRQVTKRRIDFAADNPNLLTATIPHEVTHVVLTDLYPDPMLPRWADEAMAILAEPRESVNRYLHALPKVRRDGHMFAVGQLLTMKEFPEAAAITAFYVQSVSLVDFLVAEKGPQQFSLFLNASQRYGVEKALEKSYGIKSFSDLQQRWQRKAFSHAE